MTDEEKVVIARLLFAITEYTMVMQPRRGTLDELDCERVAWADAQRDAEGLLADRMAAARALMGAV